MSDSKASMLFLLLFGCLQLVSCCGPDEVLLHGQCCPKCPEGMVLYDQQNCTNIDRSICLCDDGYFCVKRKGNGCVICKKDILCPVGEGAKHKGTIWNDAVCEKCPYGTYSDTVSSEECKPRTKCEELDKCQSRSGNSSMDSECEEKMSTTVRVLSYIGIIAVVIVVIVVIALIVLGIYFWRRCTGNVALNR